MRLRVGAGLLLLASCLCLASEESTQCRLAVADLHGKNLDAASATLVLGEQQTPLAREQDGRFTIPVGVARTARVDLAAEGMATVHLRYAEVLSHCPERVLLQPGMKVGGKVLDAAGKPVASATLRVDLTTHTPATLRRDSANDGALVDGKAAATSGADGSFDLGILPRADGYVLEVAHPSHARLTTVVRSGALPLTVKLPAIAEVRGVVLGDKDTPLSGVRIEARAGARALTEPSDIGVTTGEDGTFRLRPMAAGAWRVLIEPDDRQRILLDHVMLKSGQVLDLGAQRPARGRALRGTVRSKDGEPIAAAKVRALRHVGSSILFERMATSDAEGRFSVGGLLEGTYDLLVEPPAWYLRMRKDDLRLDGPPTAFELEKASRVSGVVLTSGGEPIARASVTPSYLDESGNPKAWNHVDQAVRTDTDGRFTYEAVEPGRVRFSVWARGWRSNVSETLDIAPGEHREQLVVTLERGQTVRGRVVARATASGIGGALVGEVQNADNATLTNQDGSFELEGLQPRDTEITVSHRDFAPATQLVAFGTDRSADVTIGLSAGAALEGTVKRSGAGVPNQKIDVDAGTRNIPTVVTGADGAFRFEHLPSGDRAIVRSDLSAMSSSEQKIVTLTDGETASVEFEMGVSVLGTVSRDGLPVAGVEIGIAMSPAELGHGRRDVPHTNGKAVSGQDGSFRIDGVQPGMNSVHLSEGRQSFTRIIMAGTQAEQRVDVALPARHVSGQVIDRDTKAPVPCTILASVKSRLNGFSYTVVNSWRNEYGELITDVTGGSARDEVTTGPDGTFEFWVDRDTDVSLILFPRGYEIPDVVLKAGAAVEGLVIKLTPKRLAKLKVDVRSSSGETLPVVSYSHVSEDVESDGSRGGTSVSNYFSMGTPFTINDVNLNNLNTFYVGAKGYVPIKQVLQNPKLADDGFVHLVFTLPRATSLRLSLPPGGGELVAIRDAAGTDWLDGPRAMNLIEPFKTVIESGVVVGGLPAAELVAVVKLPNGSERSVPVRLRLDEVVEAAIR